MAMGFGDHSMKSREQFQKTKDARGSSVYCKCGAWICIDEGLRGERVSEIISKFMEAHKKCTEGETLEPKTLPERGI